MNKIAILILSAITAIATLLTGCDKEVADDVKQQPESYKELVKAYEAGKIFESVSVVSTAKSLVKFTDGTSVGIPKTDFEIYNCTEKSPQPVVTSGGKWKIGSTDTNIKVEAEIPDIDALPVYVYFDKVTLYMRLSNMSTLKFPSKVLIEQEEARRKQNIPVVKITTDGGKGIYDKENYVKGSITISDPEKLYSDVETFTGRMGIRGRGNSTWSFPKKPWKVKLDEKAELLGMPADKEWALLANYADRTLVRNITAMKLSEICGFSWTPRMRSVEVYLTRESTPCVNIRRFHQTESTSTSSGRTTTKEML